MNIHVLSADKLTPEQIGIWGDIQRADASLASPYFRPEFTLAVASVRDDVEVGVLEEHGETVGFFPFQRGRGNVARPVGGKLSDFQGVIARGGVAWDPWQLLRDCRLSAWHFDHLIAAQEPFRPGHWKVAPSPYINLARGWEGYQASQQASHKRTFKTAMRKLPHAQRNAGPLRVEHRSDSPAVFQQLVEWKVAQYRRTGATNVLSWDWTVALLERIRTARDESFSGMMSVLYLGDRLAAILLSMRSYAVLHGWFSAYRPELSQFSPGLLLWLELARTCPELGIQRIDLGKGPEQYKTHLMSGAIDVAEGSVDFRPVTRVVRRNWCRARDWVRRSPLGPSLLRPARFLRNMVESRNFHG